MSRKRLDQGVWFESDFAIPTDAGDHAQLMIQSPTEATMQFWVRTPRPARREIEGVHLLEFARVDVAGVWQPRLFEGRHDWWMAGSGAAGSRRPEVADHPVLRAAADGALDILDGNEPAVLELGARRLRNEAEELRTRFSERNRPELELDPDRARAHVHHLAARMLDPAEAAALAPRHAAFGFGGVLETAYGPVTIHVETGPVVRIEAVPGVLLVASGENGPVEFSLSARWSLGGWDAVRPKSEHPGKAAEDILALVKEAYPSQLRSAFAAWACTTLARADMISAATARSDAVAETVLGRIAERAEAAEERIVQLSGSAPRP